MTDNIRIIEAGQITDVVSKLCIDANICLGNHIRSALKGALALENAKEAETSQLAASAIDILLENADIAKRERLPLCQDTGMTVVFVDIGQDVHIDGDVEDAINEGVRRGYREGFFRNSVVKDPIERVNTGDNTPAVIHYDFTADDDMRRKMRITVAPKGFGSENMSAVRMLTPSVGLEGAESFVVETIEKAGANPCPPIIVGVGIGGTMEKAAILSKKALLREVGTANEDPRWASSEKRLLKAINALKIGASGYGGKTTALGVHIIAYPTHIAGLPVAVNVGCHATRHKMMIL